MKRLLSIALVVAMCVTTVTVAYAAPPVTVPKVSVEETNPVIEEMWQVTENGKTSTVVLYRDANYFTVDGEKIFYSDIIADVSSKDVFHHLPQPLANAKWVYIRSTTTSAKFDKIFNSMTVAVLSAALCKYFAITSVIAVPLATVLITEYMNEDVVDLERDIYGNQYALNHYKYEDYYIVDGVRVHDATWYDPAIY